MTAESGRQPYIVYNYIRTELATSPVSWQHVMITFVLLVVVYGIIFGVFYFHYLEKIIRHGPDEDTAAKEEQVFSYLKKTNQVVGA